MDAPLPSIDNSVDGTIPSAAILASMENATFIMPTEDGMQGQDMSQTTLYTMEQVNLPPDGMVDQRTEFHSNVFLIANPGSEGFDGTHQYLSADQQCLYVVDPSMTQAGNIGIVEGATFNLVEMAPMAMASNAEHTYRYDTGTNLGSDDVISDAQAAELLMKVSESRTHDIPYVHVQLSHNSEGYTQLVEVPMDNGGALLGSGYQPMVCVQPMMQGTWTTHSVMDTTTTTTKYSDIVSASMEAISFPESAPTTINLASISQAFPEFDENTVTHSEKIKPLPRPVRSRESIEARINRLLRGQNTEDASKAAERPPEKPTTSSWSSPLCKPTPPRIIPSTLKPAIKPPKPRPLEVQPIAATTPPAAKKKKIIMHMDGIDLPLEVNMTDDTQINLPMDPQPAPQNTGTNVDDDLQLIQRGNNIRTREVWHNTGTGKYAIKVGMRTIQTSSALLKHRKTPETRSEQVANMSFSDELDTAGEIEIEYYYSATTPKNAPPPQVKVIVPVKPSPVVASPPQPQTTTKPFASYTPRARGANKRHATSAATSDPNLPTSIDLSDSVPEDELNVRLPWMKPIEEEQERPKTRDFLTRTRRSVTNDSAPVVKVYGVAQPNLSRIQPKPISTCMSSVAEEEEPDHQQTETEPVTDVQSLEIDSALETSVNEVDEIMQPEPESRVPEVTDSQGEYVVETVVEITNPGAEVRVRTPSPVWPTLCKGEDDLESGLRFTVTKTYTRQRPPKKRKKSALFLLSDDEDEEEDDDRGEDDSENVDPQTSENPALDGEPKEEVEAEASVQDISPQVNGVENGDVKESGETENSKDGCANETDIVGATGDHKSQITTDGEQKINDNSKEMEKKRERSSSSSLGKNKKSDKHRSKSDEQQIRHSSSDRVPGISSKPCPKCHERFTTSTGFLKHVAKHGVMERRLTCLLCKWESKGNVKLLEGHILKKHKNKLPS